jgi:DNA-binding CsgD family transcriptional regulator
MAVPSFNKPVISPVLVGRTLEMETLERALGMVQQNTGQCIIVAGGAGVGKSRLLSEIHQRAGAEHFLTLQGYCFEQDASFPYAPLVDALRNQLAQRTTPEIQKTLRPLASEIVKIIPELALTVPDLVPTPALEPETEKRRLIEALIQYFIRLSATQPLLIILEDLHWSDKISLDFLNLFARRLVAHPILLLASYRQEEASSHLTQLLVQFDRERLAREITLAPLARADVDAMLRAIFELSHPIQAEFMNLLFPLTEGNPFWIEEVLKALVASGEIFYSRGRWERQPLEELHIPRSVQEAVRQRIAQLGAMEREVLTLAAVAGRRFGFALLQELTGKTELDLLQVIKQLISAQLVVEESADQFAFRHALTREAVYATLLQRESLVLHKRVAQALERVYAEALDPYEADLAYHYDAAEMWAKALQYARRSGEKAQVLYAPHEAIEQFSRALKAARHLSLPLPVEILRARGRANETVGYFEAAAGDYETAFNAAQAAQDGAAIWQGLIDLGFLWASRDYARTGDYFQRALEVARILDDPITMGHSLNRLGNWYANIEQPDESLRYHHEALTLFQTMNDRRGVVETLDLLGMASQLNNNLIQAHESYRRAISLWRELGDRQGLASSLASVPLCTANYLKQLEVPATGLAEAARACEEALQLVREIGWRSGEVYALFNLAMCLGPQGEYTQALEAAQTGLTTAEEIEHRQWMAGTHTVLGMIHLDLLAFDLARSHLEQALALARAVGSQVWAGLAANFLAATCVSSGDFGNAEAILNDTHTINSPIQTQRQRLGWYVHGELALARGDAEAALHIADGLIASVLNLSAETIIPRVWKLRGEALAALGQTREAAAVLQAAQTDAFKQGAHPLVWRIHASLGNLWQAQTRREEARAEFAAAHEIIHALAAYVPEGGMRWNFVERALATMPHFRPPSVRAEKQKFGGLTVREREVAELIVQGKTNRAIADLFVVSERTIETHVSNILTKLNFTSRAQIAAWAVEKELFDVNQDP